MTPGPYFGSQLAFPLQYTLKYGLKLWTIDLSNQQMPISVLLKKQIGYGPARRAKKPIAAYAAISVVRVKRKDGKK